VSVNFSEVEYEKAGFKQLFSKRQGKKLFHLFSSTANISVDAMTQ